MECAALSLSLFQEFKQVVAIIIAGFVADRSLYLLAHARVHVSCWTHHCIYSIIHLARKGSTSSNIHRTEEKTWWVEYN